MKTVTSVFRRGRRRSKGKKNAVRVFIKLGVGETEKKVVRVLIKSQGGGGEKKICFTVMVSISIYRCRLVTFGMKVATAWRLTKKKKECVKHFQHAIFTDLVANFILLLSDMFSQFFVWGPVSWSFWWIDRITDTCTVWLMYTPDSHIYFTLLVTNKP